MHTHSDYKRLILSNPASCVNRFRPDFLFFPLFFLQPRVFLRHSPPFDGKRIRGIIVLKYSIKEVPHAQLREYLRI